MSSNPLPKVTARLVSRRWLLVIVALAVAALGVVGYWAWGPAVSKPPEIDLVGLDPEAVEAIREAHLGASRHPRSGEAWGLLGRRLHACEFHRQALSCYAEAERLEPGDSRWPYLCGLIILEGAQPAEAIPPFRRAAERGGGGQMPRLRLGESLLQQGFLEEAEEQFRAVLTNAGVASRAHLRLAQVAAARGEWLECLSQLEMVGDEPAARKEVCGLRFRACLATGDRAGAQSQQRLLAGLPEAPPWPDPLGDDLLAFPFGLGYRLGLAKKLLGQGQAPEALFLLQETVEKYPDSSLAWDTLGRMAGPMGRFQQAEQALQRSLELTPNTGDVWFNLGMLRLHQRKYEEALTAFRTAARLKPTDAQIHCKMGACLAGKGDRSGAAAAYREALRYQPDLAEALEELARLTSPR
jgi:tetratricopeptide (TPR) repeat protein